MLANKRKNSLANKDDSDTKNHKSKSKIKSEEDSVNESEIQLNLKEKSKRKDSNANSNVKTCDLESFGLTEEVIAKLKERKITSLFEIQQKVFTPIFNGENVIAASLTGSGKTLAFILPIIEKCIKKKRFNHSKPIALVLAPTRELAIQIANEFSSLASKNSKDANYYKVGLCYGGTNLDDQKMLLRKGCDIIVGTPGRVLDMINRSEITFEDLKYGVLDEADKMLEMGFQEPIEEIYSHIYKARKSIQVCLFSATIHKWVLETAKAIMNHQEHTFINLVKNLEGRCAVGVEHLAVNCIKSEKITTIADLIICYGGRKKSTIVFVPTKRECNELMVSDKLKQEVQIIHGDINQKQREASINAFKSGKVNVLVATDVASRGLDIPMIDLVIQSEPPKEIDSYIHRAGRTARAGRTGTCITLYTKMTEGLLTRIEQKAKIKFKKIGAPQNKDIIKASIRDIKDTLGSIHESSIVNFQSEAESLLKEYEPKELTSRLLAFLAGQTSEMKSRSLIVGAEGFITYKIETKSPFNSASFCWSLCRKVFSQPIMEKIKGMRTYKTMTGAVFDIEEKDLKEVEMQIMSFKNPNAGFEISRCDTLPELTTSDQRFNEIKRGSDTRNRRDIFVGNLPYSCVEKDVWEFLKKNGVSKDNLDLRMVIDNESGTHKGFCFLSAYDDIKFNQVLNIQNRVLNGKNLRIDDASNKR